jgi:hypothetical protein
MVAADLRSLNITLLDSALNIFLYCSLIGCVMHTNALCQVDAIVTIYKSPGA